MSNAMEMINRCVLHQGGGPQWLDEQDALGNYARRVFGPDSVVAASRKPFVFDPEPVTHSTLARWAMNLPPADTVIENLAEPTRKEFQE